MTPAEFKKKWARVSAKESAAYQSHFDDLCRMLHLPPPLEADPTGDKFCYQKHVVKDAELFDMTEIGEQTEPTERGFADVWKKGCFAWEYKGKKKNLEDAYKQLLRYRESLQNPPLLIVCDFDRFIIRTNFNGTVQEIHEFTNASIDEPKNLHCLRAAFTDPDFLKPQRTTVQVTEDLAQKIAEVAMSLQKREGKELANVKTRKENTFAQGKNLRVARFLNRIVFCFFAEDTGLLPKNLFSEIAKTAADDPKHFAETLENLFSIMAKGGNFGQHKIRHFNGHLFEDSSVFELTEEELRHLYEASEADWQFIQPSIMGTLFERALDEAHRSKLGAHYTSEEDIHTLLEPVLMAPLRCEWVEIKKQLNTAYFKGKGTIPHREKLAVFLQKIAATTVLDPACGSGNFLYVSLKLLLGLEKDVIAYASQMGFRFGPQVNVQQLKAIEINPYAFELAQVSVQIGYLQWRRDNGFDNDRNPVLQNLDGFQNDDALLIHHYRNKAKNLKEAQQNEHKTDDVFRFYTDRDWPRCNVIVGNPPFLGDKLMRRELSDDYVEELRQIYEKRIPGQSDFCCYWFEKARDLIEQGKCYRAGLIATQGIRGGANREVLKRIKETGDIFFTISDRKWILDGANVHVSMVGFDDGTDKIRFQDGESVSSINANLSSASDTTQTVALSENARCGFIGVSMHGPFDFEEIIALQYLSLDGNPTGLPNSDVIRPIINAFEITKRTDMRWIVAFSPEWNKEKGSLYEGPFQFVINNVKPIRDENNRKAYRDRWWIHGEGRPAMLHAIKSLPRFLVTPRVSKHRLFVWMTPERLPSDATVAFARSDDYFFGVLHSRFHEVWALEQGTQLREKESGFRYTPTTCFDTFPLPQPKPEQEIAIAKVAKELNELRERWLNPPEWTYTYMLSFSASIEGPWASYIDPATVNKIGVGRVNYPRLKPNDEECEGKLKNRTLTNLYNERPTWLDLAHKKLDAAVAAAYGWTTVLTDEQILEKLLALNLERAAAEASKRAVPIKRISREKNADEML